MANVVAQLYERGRVRITVLRSRVRTHFSLWKKVSAQDRHCKTATES